MSENFEQFMADVFTSPNYKPAQTENPFESEEYQKYVESMVQYCRCRESNRPCDGVLSGGICDNLQDEERETHPSHFDLWIDGED